MALFGTPTSRFSTSADKDIEVPQPPGDSVSSLAFSNQADYLAVGSWDNTVCTPKSSCSETAVQSSVRFEFTKSVPMVKHRGKLCINMTDRSWEFVGIRYVVTSHLELILTMSRKATR